MKKWKIELTVEVSENWITDGFNLSEELREEQIKNNIRNMLPFAYDNEVRVEITSNTFLHRPEKESIN